MSVCVRRDKMKDMNVRTYLPSWFLERSRVLRCEHFHLLVAGSVTMWFPHNLNETKACRENEWEEGWDTRNHIFTSFQGINRQLGNCVMNHFSWRVKKKQTLCVLSHISTVGLNGYNFQIKCIWIQVNTLTTMYLYIFSITELKLSGIFACRQFPMLLYIVYQMLLVFCTHNCKIK